MQSLFLAVFFVLTSPGPLTHSLSLQDACLQKLFESGKVLSSALGWMGDTRSSPERKASAALIVANMARNGRCVVCV